jgi:hypothetical protein
MTRPSDHWKNIERRAALLFGARRTPLSGSNSGHATSSDSLHPGIYLEVKLRKKVGVIGLYRDTETKAAKEFKLPVVALCEGGDSRVYAVIPLESGYLLTLAGELQKQEAVIQRQNYSQGRLSVIEQRKVEEDEPNGH